jgi:hypothetical protein
MSADSVSLGPIGGSCSGPGCMKRLLREGPSDTFCSAECQHRWHSLSIGAESSFNYGVPVTITDHRHPATATAVVPDELPPVALVHEVDVPGAVTRAARVRSYLFPPGKNA